MDLGLKKKIAIITGASRGIGAASAKAIAYHGATVIINYHQSEAKAKQILAEIISNGGSGMIFQADVKNRQEVDKMVSAAISKFGKIDILVSNASTGFPVKPFVELTWNDIESKILGEISALYNCSQSVLPDMAKRKSGKLIFISSGLSRSPGPGFAAQAAAKSAVDGIAKVMAMELGPMGITVNVIGPGLTLTDSTANQPKEMFEQLAAITPLKRLGQPEDVAGAALFLASSLSDFLTGEYLPVNGGKYMI